MSENDIVSHAGSKFGYENILIWINNYVWALLVLVNAGDELVFVMCCFNYLQYAKFCLVFV